jgi:hypothetical protein
MPIRILATADLHLGKTSADVSGHFAATKHTWETIVNWAIAYAVDVVALCGDIVDRDNRYFEAVGPLQDGLEKLGKNGIEVFMVPATMTTMCYPASSAADSWTTFICWVLMALGNYIHILRREKRSSSRAGRSPA